MAKPNAMTKLRDLASRAGRWLGLQAPAVHTGAAASAGFDEMTWRDIRDQAGAVREVIEDLGERHDYAADLVRDMFLASYKASPQLHAAADMDPSRLVNRQAIASMLASPEFAELRRETAGDPYASAMAVIAQVAAVRRMLKQAKEAQQAADEAAKACQEQQGAAQAVSEALQQAAAQAGEEGTVPASAAGGAEQAMARAAQAGQSAQDESGEGPAAAPGAPAGLRGTA